MDAGPTKFPLFLSVGTEAWIEGQKRGGSENKKKKGRCPAPLIIPSLTNPYETYKQTNRHLKESSSLTLYCMLWWCCTQNKLNNIDTALSQSVKKWNFIDTPPCALITSLGRKGTKPRRGTTPKTVLWWCYSNICSSEKKSIFEHDDMYLYFQPRTGTIWH